MIALLLTVSVLSADALLSAMRHAPLGYEDETGFRWEEATRWIVQRSRA